MDKFNYPRNLISYTSEHKLAGQKQDKFRLKLIGYGVFSVLIVAAMVAWLSIRVPIETSVLRDRNALYRINDVGLVENTYIIKITNKTQHEVNYRVTLNGTSAMNLNSPSIITISAGELKQFPVTIAADAMELPLKVTPISFTVSVANDNSIYEIHDSKFYRP